MAHHSERDTDNKAVVRALYDECINERRLERLEDYVAPEFVGARGERGPAELRRAIESVLAGFPGVRFELHDLVGEGDRVAVRWSFRAVHRGPFAGMAPTMADVTQDGHVIYQLARGRIVRAWQQVDRLGVLQQIGALPRQFAASAPDPRA